MRAINKKEKFFQVLKNIFIGAEIEGASGYVNLMRIKSRYYHAFKTKLVTDIDDKLTEVGRNFEEELYNKLYTFFKKYFSESGSIYFTYTPLHEKIYERVYQGDQDVMLFWKTHMLYYVKTERLYQNIEVEEQSVRYIFDVSHLAHKQNNERRDLLFTLQKYEKVEHKPVVTFNVQYATQGTKTKPDQLLKQLRKEDKSSFHHLTEKDIEHVCGIFKKQSEVDYFINKNAKSFLREQFSLWMKSYLIDDETLFEVNRLKQLKALQEIAFYIIDLVSQFEDELVKIWNKPKYVHSSHYVITLDKIASKNLLLLQKIIQQKGIKKQVQEWQSLGMIPSPFDVKTIIQNNKLHPDYQYLPLDTKHVKDLELDILALFDDLDHQLDGWLIHSENYQALNTLQDKFREKVQTVYIDPPFNTGSDFAYLDNYQMSSWLSLLDNRISLAKIFLYDKANFWLHLDYNAVHHANMVLSQIFGKENYVNEVIWRKRAGGGNDSKYIANEHDNILVYAKKLEKAYFNGIERSQKLIEKYKRDSKGYYSEKPLNEPSLQDSPGLHYDITLPNGTILLGAEHQWKISQKTFKEKLEKNEILFKKNKVYYKHYIEVNKELIPSSIFYTTGFNADGTKDFKSVFDDNYYSYLKQHYGKPTIKPEKLLKKITEIASSNGDCILDFFMGYATTQAVAHKLGRKWIGVEMGEHFHTVCLPRMKKVLFGVQSGISKETNFKGGGFFKYYALEQYEHVLSKVKYEDKNELPTQSIYHQYLFLKDLKLADQTLQIDQKNKRIRVNLTKLHPHIDIPETLSHLTGKFIKQITKNKVTFEDNTSIDLTNIDYKIVKPLIWW